MFQHQKLLEKIEDKKIRESATRWHNKIHDLSEKEMTGLLTAIEIENQARALEQLISVPLLEAGEAN